MACFDEINDRFPKSISITATGLNKSWQSITSNWQNFHVV